MGRGICVGHGWRYAVGMRVERVGVRLDRGMAGEDRWLRGAVWV